MLTHPEGDSQNSAINLLGKRTTVGKALDVNLDLKKYGAFAEIGAGQEVARFFFQAGKASATIAKTMSAYDMVYSDEIYGKEKSGRYVCESRVQKMLEKEFQLLQRRLDSTRGEDTEFFAFANTVATGSSGARESQGWLGLKFQTAPRAEPSEITVHIRMLDRNRIQQQETLGVLGVNLIHSSFYHRGSLGEFLPFLMEHLKPEQVAIDFVRISGPAFAALDMRELNLELVLRGLTELALFQADSAASYFPDAVFNKSVLIQRGSFRPITRTHLDILAKGAAQFHHNCKESELSFLEMDVTPEAAKFGEVESTDLESRGLLVNERLKTSLLTRISLINSLHLPILVSHCRYFYQLKRVCRKYTSKPMAMVIAASHLEKLFSESFYQHLEGGILEGLGKLLDDKTAIYVYPHKTNQLCLTAQTLNFPEPLQKLYRFFIERRQIFDIAGCDEIDEFFHSRDVFQEISSGSRNWLKHVPSELHGAIEANKKSL